MLILPSLHLIGTHFNSFRLDPVDEIWVFVFSDYTIRMSTSLIKLLIVAKAICLKGFPCMTNVVVWFNVHLNFVSKDQPIICSKGSDISLSPKYYYQNHWWTHSLMFIRIYDSHVLDKLCITIRKNKFGIYIYTFILHMHYNIYTYIYIFTTYHICLYGTELFHLFLPVYLLFHIWYFITCDRKWDIRND